MHIGGKGMLLGCRSGGRELGRRYVVEVFFSGREKERR